MILLLSLAAGLILSRAAAEIGPPQGQPAQVVKSQLTRDDSLDLKDRTYFKVHAIPLQAGMNYRIDLESRQFSPYLRLREPTGREIAVQGDLAHAQVIVKAAGGGRYQVLATSMNAGQTGPYVLTVTELDPAGLAAALLEVRVKRIGSSPPQERRQILDELKKHLGGLGPKLEKKDLALARQAAHSLEFLARDLPLAAEAYARFATLAAASADAEVARSARFLEGAARRLKLRNRPLSIQGVTVDGRPLDWKAYRGKVVLVSFVDTTNFASAAEWRGSLKVIYARYKDRGFAVLGVSLNKDRQSLEQFLKAENIPWPCVHDVAAGAGGPGPLAEHLGISAAALPLDILVDRAGKVVATTATGPNLMVLLPRYVGQPAPPPFPVQGGQPFPPRPGAFRPDRGPSLPAGPGRSGESWTLLAVLLVVGMVILLVLLPFALILAFQAHRRGYHGVIWCLTGLLSFNPMFPLVVLALLPHRARQARRLKEMQALQNKLACPPVAAMRPGPSPPQATPPVVPASAGSTATFPARSLGDEVTRV
jgi:hypothetical protein